MRNTKLTVTPIKCANPKCDWTGALSDWVPHPDDVGGPRVRQVCPKCQGSHYAYPRRKGGVTYELITETTPVGAKTKAVGKSLGGTLTPTAIRRLATEAGISYSTNEFSPYATVKQLQAFAKAVVVPHHEARAKLSNELRAVVEWARVEKAPLREQELQSILHVLKTHGL